jgi:MFS transporter, DHA3 family, macrolide efflux protein
VIARRLLLSGDRDERLFLYANFASNLGNGIQIIAAAYLVLVRTNSVFSVGVLLILAALPQAFLSGLSGALADKGHHKSLCIGSDLIRAACVAAIPVSLYLDSAAIPVLYVATFVVSLFDSVFLPVGSSWMQNLLNRDHYARFSMRFEVSTQSAVLISSAVGGFCIQWFSVESVFIFNALTFIVSAALLILMAPAREALGPALAARRDAPEPPPRPIPWRRLAPALVLFAQSRIMATIMNTLLVVLVIEVFKRGTGVLGVTDALAGLGFTIGALAFGRVHLKLPAPLIVVVGTGLAALFVFPQPLWGVPGLMLTFVAACVVYGICRPAARLVLMNDIEDAYSGRVFGAANAIGFIGGAAGTLIVSKIVTAASITVAYACVGAYLLAVTFLAGVPLLRRTRPEEPATPVPDQLS